MLAWIAGLSFITTEDRLRNCFSRFGQLVEVKIMMDRVAKRSKGFGFIEYATEEEAEAAIKGMDVLGWQGYFCRICKI